MTAAEYNAVVHQRAAQFLASDNPEILSKVSGASVAR